MADLVDHGFYDLARTLDQIQDGKQDLSVGLAELLNYGGALTGSASNDVVWFLHGGRLLSVFLRLATGFYRIGANRRLPTFNYDRDTLARRPRLTLSLALALALALRRRLHYAETQAGGRQPPSM
jgi:hypothetical protein